MSRVIDKFRQTLNKTLSDREMDVNYIPAQIGDGQGNVNVPNRPNFIYAQVNGVVQQVYNGILSPQYATNCWVTRKASDPNFLQTVETRGDQPLGVNTTLITAGYPPSTWYEYGGKDPIFLDLRQFLPGMVRKNVASGMLVDVIRDWSFGTSIRWFDNLLGQDLTSYIPTTPGNAALILFTVNNAGTIVLTKGAETTLTTLSLDNTPTPPNDTVRILGIERVYYGQTALVEGLVNATDFFDPRMANFTNHNYIFGLLGGSGSSMYHLTQGQYNWVASGSGTTAGGHTIENNGTPMTTRGNLNFIGATVTDNPGNNSTDVTITGGGGNGVTLSWFIDGALVSGSQLGMTYVLPANMTIGKITAYLETPGSGSTIADIILWNQASGSSSGSSLWNVHPANRPTLSSGSQSGVFTPDITSATTGQILSLDITSVGTGAGILTVTISNTAASGGIAASGSVVDGHLAVWNGTSGCSIKDGGAVPASPGLVKLSETLLSGSAINIDVTGISASYRHLKLMFQGRGTTGGVKNVQIQFNGDSGSNYYGEHSHAYGTTINSGENLAATNITVGYISGSDATAGFAGGFEATVFNYAQTTFVKSLVSTITTSQTTGTGNTDLLGESGWWNSTAAINEITLTTPTGGFATGTILSVYGLT